MKYLYWIYQLLIAAPILLIATILCAVTVILFSPICPSWVGYYPPMVWSRLMCWVCLLPVRVEGREHLSKHQSYVFVCNHQGAYDIFLVYGFLGRNFRWMMKKSLRNIPLVGKACERAGHVMVDKSGPKAINATCEQGRKVLRGGISLVVFPEGAHVSGKGSRSFRENHQADAASQHLPSLLTSCIDSFWTTLIHHNVSSSFTSFANQRNLSQGLLHHPSEIPA